MTRARRWWDRYVQMHVMEVRRPDGSTYVTSIDAVGFGECWLPIEILTTEEGEVSVSV